MTISGPVTRNWARHARQQLCHCCLSQAFPDSGRRPAEAATAALLTRASLHGCRRRIGRWLTDVTPLLPLLSSSKCTFHLQTVSWALTWQPSLTLRFRNSTHAATAAEGAHDSQLGGNPVSDAGLELRPEPASSALGASVIRSAAQSVADERGKGGFLAAARRLQQAANSMQHPGPPVPCTEPDSKVHHAHSRHMLVALFKGGTFDASYNSQGREVQLKTPQNYSGALLEAVITGQLQFLCACLCRLCLLSRCICGQVLSPAGSALWSVPSDLKSWPVGCSVATAVANAIKGSMSRQPSQLPNLLQGTAATSSSVPSFVQLRTISL